MEETCVAVLKYCNAEFAYSQSDEISLLLRNDKSENQTPFLGNRVQKLVSLLASTASVAFSRETGLTAVFDGRCFVLPPNEVVNYFIWRQEDAFKNYVSSMAYYGLKERHGRKKAQRRLHKKSINERQEIIYQELGKNPNSGSPQRKRGFLVERETYEATIGEVITQESKLEELIAEGHIKSRNGKVTRSHYAVRRDLPRFTKNRDYILTRITQ